MTMRELAQLAARSFCMMVTFIVFGAWAVGALFAPQYQFYLTDLGKIIVLALACSALFLVFYSKKDLSVRQMRLRMVIHVILLLAVVVGLCLLWDWVRTWDTPRLALIVGLTLASYSVVTAFVFYWDSRAAKKLDNVLRKNRYKR